MTRTIPLTSITSSLLFTLINAVVELAFLSAMFIILALYECRFMNKGKRINIRRHCIFAKLIPVVAMVMFISLEILFSTTVTDERRPILTSEPCIRTKPNTPFQPVTEEDSAESRAVAFHCLKVKDGDIEMRAGNFSIAREEIECDKKPLYRYTPEASSDIFPLDNSTTACIDDTSAGEGLGRACAGAMKEGNEILLSTAISEKTVNEPNNQSRSTIGLVRTTLFFDVDDHLEDVARGNILLRWNSVTESFVLRRRIFLMASNDTCEFKTGEDEITVIPEVLIVILLLLWTISLLVFGLALFNRRNVFYDLRNTWDWATKTYHLAEAEAKGDLYIKCVEINGAKRMYVTSADEADDFEAGKEEEMYKYRKDVL